MKRKRRGLLLIAAVIMAALALPVLGGAAAVPVGASVANPGACVCDNVDCECAGACEDDCACCAADESGGETPAPAGTDNLKGFKAVWQKINNGLEKYAKYVAIAILVIAAAIVLAIVWAIIKKIKR